MIRRGLAHLATGRSPGAPPRRGAQSRDGHKVLKLRMVLLIAVAYTMDFKPSSKKSSLIISICIAMLTSLTSSSVMHVNQ